MAIAYQVVGDGPMDVVFVRGFAGDVLSVWEQPLLAQFIEGLAAFSRVILIDKRGTGLSDRCGPVPLVEDQIDDLRAVLDATGSERPVLFGVQDGARLAALFAATHPERVAGLVLFDPTAKGREASSIRGRGATKSGGCGCARSVTAGGAPSSLTLVSRSGHQINTTIPLSRMVPRAMRRGLSPGSALAFFRMMMESDVDVLPVVRPDRHPLQPGAAGPWRVFRASHRGSTCRAPGLRSIYHWVDVRANEIALTETRRIADLAVGEPTTERVLSTVLFTDLVGSTERAVEAGDEAWATFWGAIAPVRGSSTASAARRSTTPATAS